MRKSKQTGAGFTQSKRMQESRVGLGTSLVVQWLRLHAPKSGRLDSIPGQGTRSHMLPLEEPVCTSKTQLNQINKCAVLSHFSCVHLFVTLWTAAHQAPLSMRFFRQDYWSGLPFPTPGDLPNPGMEPTNILKRERELSWSQTEHRNWWRSSRVDFLSQF